MPHIALRLGLLLVVFFWSAPSSVAQSRRAESSAKKRITRSWLDLAQFAIERKSKATAVYAINRAAFYTDDDSQLMELKQQAAALEADSEDSAVANRKRKIIAEVCGELDKLAKSKTSRSEPYLERALELQPDNAARRAGLARAVALATKARSLDRARRLLRIAADHDADNFERGAYANAEVSLGTREFSLIKAKSHPLQALLVLPKNWSPRKKYSVLVYVDGSGAGYTSAAQVYRQFVNRFPSFVVLVPITISNTHPSKYESFPYAADILEPFKTASQLKRVKWDAEGLHPIVAAVHKRFSTEPGVFITGYSGGGYLTHWWAIHYPDQTRGAVLGSANFGELVFDGAAEMFENGGPRMRLITGAQDPRGELRIFAHNDRALEEYKRRGATKVERLQLKGRTHEPFIQEGFEFFKNIRLSGSNQ